MSHGILKQAVLHSSALVLLLACAMLVAPARAVADSQQSPSQACGNLSLPTAGAISACQKAYSTYTDPSNKDNEPSKDTVCPSSQYPDPNDLAGCKQGYDVASGADPAIDVNCSNTSCDLISKYINPAINLLSVAFGLIVVISLILGGIQFAASEGDPQKASQAKNRISNTVLALLVYSLFYGFLQFLVPGGLFH